MTPSPKPQGLPAGRQGFFGLGIAPKLLDAVDRLNITEPTPIQAQAIPVAISGQDVMGIAQTGTGKTFAFGIPMLQRLAQVKGRGLVILPTRELALQVAESLEQIGGSVGLRTAVLIGGVDMRKQIRALARKPHVIIGTPGRINDHLEQKTVDLKDVRILVLDEADRMLDMGFAPQIRRIVAHVPKERQTMLFSATMPRDIVQMASSYMKLPVRVEVAPAGTASERVSQELIIVPKPQKLGVLETLLTEDRGSVLVFTRTKHGARKLCRVIKDMGHTSAELHSNRSLNQRKEALQGFKTGKYRVLVATDIAARGIDVRGIELVVNFDIPENPEDYVHRIGRTGRAGREGRAISLASPDQIRLVKDIERLVRKPLPLKSMPSVSPSAAAYAPAKQSVLHGEYNERSGRNRRRHRTRQRPNSRFGRGRRDRFDREQPTQKRKRRVIF